MIVCPGCGGRNAEGEAKTCEWCGRPFVPQPRRLGASIALVVAAAVIGVVVLVAAAMAVTALVSTLAARASDSQSSAIPPTEIPLLRPTVEPTPPTGEVTAGQEFVRVANTGGAGAFIREEPRLAARGIEAQVDGTILKVVGTDVSVESRPWRNVETARGNRGWTPAEFLVPSDAGF